MYNNRGAAYSRKGDFDRAIADYDEAIRLDPRQTLFHTNRINAYAHKGDFDTAIAACDERIRLEANAVYYNNRGVYYSEVGEVDRAIADYTEAVRLDPNDAVAYSNRAFAFSGKGELDKALADFQQAIRLEPRLSWAYLGRGRVYVKKGDLDRAIADFDKAIAIEGDPIAYCSRAEAWARRGNMESALADLAKAAQSDPPEPRYKSDLAWLLANCQDPRLRRVDRALELATLALKQAPKHAAIWTTLGAAEYRAGHWQAAVDALQKSSELKYYRVARTGFFLAMAHWQLGQKDEARQWYDKAVEWMEKNQPEDEELRRFRAEAAELLGIENEQRE